ncbi:MAG: hypothetical protein ABIH34_04880, partial [Nanoarchaeota archaeon]
TNFEIRTYKDGVAPPICEGSTFDTKNPKNNNKGLNVWGRASDNPAVETCPGNSDFKEGDGCDRNGNGIYGQYGEKYVGKPWEETLEHDVDKSKKIMFLKETPEGIKLKERYFPDGKVQPSGDGKSGLGEGCFDSPTFVDCTDDEDNSDIRVYFCGWRTATMPQYTSKWYRKDDDGLHSNKGARFMAVLGSKIQDPITAINRETEQSIRVVDSGGKSKNILVGASEFAQKYDLEYTLSIITLNPSRLMADVLTGFERKPFDDPSIICAGGEEREGGIKVKCDPMIDTCAMCGFELPQDVNFEKKVLADYISGMGDPKYLVYYEAFPYGEEEAWEISEAETTLLAHAAIFNIGVPLITEIAKLTPWGRKLVATPAKLWNLGRKIVQGTRRTASMFNKVAHRVTPAKMEEAYVVVTRLVKDAPDAVASRVGKQTAQTFSSKAGSIWVPNNFGKVVQGINPPPQIVNEFGEAITSQVQNNPAFKEAMDALWKKHGTQIAKVVPVTDQGIYYTMAHFIVTRELLLQESIEEKYVPIGFNAIGKKTPFEGVLKSGLFPLTDPLADEVKPYYLSLVRDHRKGGVITQFVTSQADQRLFFASPCKANLAVWKDKCVCKLDDKMPIKYMNFKDGSPVYTDKGDKDATPVFAPEGVSFAPEEAIKYCPSTKASRQNWFIDPEDKIIDCIRTDPIILDGYCYGGEQAIVTYGEIGFLGMAFIANVGVEIAAGTISVPTTVSVVGIPLTVIIQIGKGLIQTLVDWSAYTGIHELNEEYKWPNHPGLKDGT